jgi:hypothetical protein
MGTPVKNNKNMHFAIAGVPRAGNAQPFLSARIFNEFHSGTPSVTLPVLPHGAFRRRRVKQGITFYITLNRLPDMKCRHIFVFIFGRTIWQGYDDGKGAEGFVRA